MWLIIDSLLEFTLSLHDEITIEYGDGNVVHIVKPDLSKPLPAISMYWFDFKWQNGA